MIIQTAPAGEPRLAVMMYEHTQLFPGSLRELSVAIRAGLAQRLMYCCVDEEKANDWFEGSSKIAAGRGNIERIPDNSAGIRAPETIRGELYKTDKQLPHELYARPLADNIPIGNVL